MSNNYTKLFRFAYFPKYDTTIKYLAENLADKEDWDFSDLSEKNYSILKNYLEFTYRKLEQEKKIHFTSDNSYACLNKRIYIHIQQVPERDGSAEFCGGASSRSR